MKNAIIFASIFSSITWFYSAPSWSEGAFAVGRSQGRVYWGTSRDETTLRDARNIALRNCQQNGPGCSVVTTFRRVCFAVAFQVGGAGHTWATKGSIADAQRFVMADCQNHGRPCQIRASFCDTVDEAETQQEAARRDAERREAERREWERREAERRAEERRQADLRETQRREAERREWERLEAERRAKNQRDYLSNASFSPATAIGLIIGVLLAGITAIVKTDMPQAAKIFVAIATPVASLLLQHYLGVEFKGGVTLYEFTLLNIPGGGALVGAITYKLVA